MSLQYTIRVAKDHANVTAMWDIAWDMSDAEIIRAFTLTVNGKTLNTQCSGRTKACKAADYTILAHPNEKLNCAVLRVERGDCESPSELDATPSKLRPYSRALAPEPIGIASSSR
jgi:hypothetical protein